MTVLLAAIVGLGGVTLAASPRSTDPVAPPTYVQAATTSNAELRTLVAHIDREWPGGPGHQAFTAESLALLATTIESIATSRKLLTPALITVLDRLRTETRRFAAGRAEDSSQSTQLRHVFTTATDLMSRLAGNEGATEEVAARLAALRRTADSLDGRQLLSRQPDVVERFFHQSAELLRDITSAP